MGAGAGWTLQRRNPRGCIQLFRPVAGLFPSNPGMLGLGRRPSRRADGEFRGGPPHHRIGPRGASGSPPDLPRHRDGRILRERGAPSGLPSQFRRDASPDGPRLRWGRAQPPGPPQGPGGTRETGRRPQAGHPCHPRRTGYLPHLRPGIRAGTGGLPLDRRRRRRGYGDGAVLGHGPGPALGAHRKGLSGLYRRRGPQGRLGGRGDPRGLRCRDHR